ncbi:MAG TPA: secretin N-terminal domain-containing protein [Candidatus Baltobacteraceae bacterium]|jgi:type II secretory pathway component GspD/PulD (secretin)|nr:secretin N-terminal domain-containing protein [Candidatus Baltobacteraceae bacterium]
MRQIALCLALLLGCAASALAAPLVTLDVHDAELGDVLALLASQSGINIVADSSIKPERVTLHLRNVSFDDALTVLVQAHDLQVRRQSGIVIVGTSESMNRRYGDANDPRSPRTVVVNLSHGSPDEVAKELSAGLPDGTVIVPDKRTASIVLTGNADTIARGRQLAAALDGPAADGAADPDRVYPLKYHKASELASALKGILPDGSYLADDAQNAIIVSGNSDLQRTASGFVRSMDVPSPQVLFEVRVADLTPENDNSNVGITFGGVDLQGQPVPGAATWAFARNSISINATLNAMITHGHAQILATPKLVTINNKEADLLIGQTYPVVYYDSQLGGQQVQFVDIGVKLRLTPTIGPDGSVTAEMHPEYSAIEGFVGGYPIIANRKIDSTLRVGDNQTIVLGGLLRDVDSQTLTRMPGLADIPILGKIFQSKQQNHERDEVVFLITPHVIYPNSPLPTK